MQCPTCKLEFSAEASSALPFCCERCKLIDLGRWLDESYGLPNVPDPEDDETSEDNWTGETSADSPEPSSN